MHCQICVFELYSIFNYKKHFFPRKIILSFGIKAFISFVVHSYKYKSMPASEWICVQAWRGVYISGSFQAVYGMLADLHPCLMRDISILITSALILKHFGARAVVGRQPLSVDMEEWMTGWIHRTARYLAKVEFKNRLPTIWLQNGKVRWKHIHWGKP